MKIDLNHIIFFRDVPPEQLAELRALAASNPDVAVLCEAWIRYRRTLQDEIRAKTADPELFVLAALYEHGRRSALTAGERHRVEGALGAFRETLHQHPGLEGAAQEISAAADEFERLWDEWFAGDESDARSAAAGRTASRKRSERSAISLRHRDRSGIERRRVGRWGVRVAIGSALVLFVALLVFVAQRDHTMLQIRTAASETRIVELGDGSTVRLLPESELSFTPPGETAPLGRQALVRGRAYFDVVPAGGGLVVKTPTAQLTVLGTSFGVRADDELTEVVLAEGRLTFAQRRDPTRPVTLSAGQMSRVSAGGSPIEPQDIVVHEELSWTGLFIFTSTPLPIILSTLEDHYGVSLTLSSELESERVTGHFDRSRQLSEILETIAAATGADVRAISGGYRLD